MFESVCNKQPFSSLDHNPSSSFETSSASDDRSFVPETFYGMLFQSTSAGYNSEKRAIPNSPPRKVVKTPVKKQVSGCVNSIAGVKLRRNSVRTAAEQRNHGGVKRTILADCYAVEKISEDPLNDFRESMVEMIQENQGVYGGDDSRKSNQMFKGFGSVFVLLSATEF